MKEQEDRQLEHLVAKAIQKTTLETPSSQFTNKVMAAVNAQPQSVAIRYSPLIPKYIWIVIAALIVGFTTYLWFFVQPTPMAWPKLSFNFMDNNLISKGLAAITPSKITVYAVLLFAVMVCVQVPILKNYFDKRRMV